MPGGIGLKKLINKQSTTYASNMARACIVIDYLINLVESCDAVKIGRPTDSMPSKENMAIQNKKPEIRRPLHSCDAKDQATYTNHRGIPGFEHHDAYLSKT